MPPVALPPRISASASLAVSRESFVSGFATVDYRGTVDATLDRMSVVAIQNSATSFDLTRQ